MSATATPPANAAAMASVLGDAKAKGIPVETHLFANSGHGFGLRKSVGKPVEVWPDLWRAWARTTGLG